VRQLFAPRACWASLQIFPCLWLFGGVYVLSAGANSSYSVSDSAKTPRKASSNPTRAGSGDMSRAAVPFLQRSTSARFRRYSHDPVRFPSCSLQAVCEVIRPVFCSTETVLQSPLSIACRVFPNPLRVSPLPFQPPAELGKFFLYANCRYSGLFCRQKVFFKYPTSSSIYKRRRVHFT